MLDCIHATEYYFSHYLEKEDTHSSTIAPLLLLRLCQGIVTNCPLLAEIDVDRAPSYDACSLLCFLISALEELETNTYGIGVLFRNVKESLDTLSVKRILYVQIHTILLI